MHYPMLAGRLGKTSMCCRVPREGGPAGFDYSQGNVMLSRKIPRRTIMLDSIALLHCKQSNQPALKEHSFREEFH